MEFHPTNSQDFANYFAAQGDKSDAHMPVQFYARSIENPLFGKKEGEMPRKNLIYIKIFLDGGLSIYDQPAVTNSPDVEEGMVLRDAEGIRDDARRFKRQWDAFLNGRSDEIMGTPLSVIFPHDPAKVDNYKHFQVRTVEQLANTPIQALQQIGAGAVTDANIAKEFMKGGTERRQEDLEERFEEQLVENEFLKDQIREMSQRIEEMASGTLAQPTKKKTSQQKSKTKKTVESSEVTA